ncbi:MAG: hypothetical protein ACXWXO_17640 [Nocardioides sp.]
MPDRRLVLPRDVMGANAFSCAGCTHGSLADLEGDPASTAVLVLPSLLHLMQAGWLAALRAGEWFTFEGWLKSALDDAEHEPSSRPTWRYDRVVAAYAGTLGADRVRVVVGEDPAAAAAVLADLSGTPAQPPVLAGWTRALSWAEVGTLEALLFELEDLGLTGRNASEMVDGGADQLMRSGTPVPLGLSPLLEALEGRLVELAAEMAAAVDVAGVRVSGDLTKLAWPPREGDAVLTVGVAEAAELTMGMLERVTTWSPEEETG